MPIDPIVQAFISEYHQQKAVEISVEALLDPKELMQIEDGLSDVICGVDLLNLTEDEREDLRGLRVAEMADLMYDTAAGLRDFANIAKELGASPEVFENIVEQDLALGGIIQSLQLTYRRADTGLLQASERGEDALVEVEREVSAAISREASEPKREAMEARFADVMGHRRRIELRAREAVAGPASPQPEEEQLKVALDQQALDELIRDFAQAALKDRDKDKNPRPTAEKAKKKG